MSTASASSCACDFNVPVADGVVGDTDGRIKAAHPHHPVPSLTHNAKVILMSPPRPPQGQRPGAGASRSLPLPRSLAELSGRERLLRLPIPYGEAAAEAAAALEPGRRSLVLENVRFDKRENAKNDAERESSPTKLRRPRRHLRAPTPSAPSHRAQGIRLMAPPSYLPAVAGFLLEKEVSTLSKASSASPSARSSPSSAARRSPIRSASSTDLLEAPPTPLIVGGGMAYTFAKPLRAATIGNSLLRGRSGATARSEMHRQG